MDEPGPEYGYDMDWQDALTKDPEWDMHLDTIRAELDQERNMKIGEMKPSKYVKKEDVEDGVIVTIKSISEDNVAMENEEPEMKFILHFAEDIKPLVMNWTNIQLCAKATGSEDTDDWKGKKIVLYNDPNVSFGGNITGGVRIRSAEQKAPKPAPAKGYDEKNPPPIGEDPSDEIPF